MKCFFQKLIKSDNSDKSVPDTVSIHIIFTLKQQNVYIFYETRYQIFNKLTRKYAFRQANFKKFWKILKMTIQMMSSWTISFSLMNLWYKIFQVQNMKHIKFFVL